MSVDFQLAHKCPHLVIEEPVGLEDDRRSLLPRAPIGNTLLLRVLVNNEQYVPPAGLHSQAILTGALSGPFNIEGCQDEGGVSVDSNVLVVQSSSESHTFNLPIGSRVSADKLVRIFRDAFSDIVVANEGGHLVFTDIANIGFNSRLKLSGRATTALGFGGHRGIRGKQLYPGWRLEKRDDILPRLDRNGVVLTYARYPKFITPVRTNPTFKMTYVATADRCPRCQAKFKENDWRFDPQGELVTIENENLLQQAALKILLTDIATNPFHRAYGSRIQSRIGAKAVGAVATLLREDVVTALTRMQDLQSQQAKFQKVSLKERMSSILSVDVLPHKRDQTAFLIDVVVSNGTGEPVTLTVVFAVPGAVALVGSNNLSLGLDSAGLDPKDLR